MAFYWLTPVSRNCVRPEKLGRFVPQLKRVYILSRPGDSKVRKFSKEELENLCNKYPTSTFYINPYYEESLIIAKYLNDITIQVDFKLMKYEDIKDLIYELADHSGNDFRQRGLEDVNKDEFSLQGMWNPQLTIGSRLKVLDPTN